MNHAPTLPQVTVKAVILGIILAVVLAGANAYLGLFAGMTVSASIPAAVISMAVLRLFARSNILENNIVQTTASAGEAVAAGVIFTMPALYLLGFWSDFDYAWVAAIAALGGVLGVLFSVPLRRALIVERKLPFPEGMATAEVLKAGDTGAGIRVLAGAALAGGAAKFCEVGLHLWSGTAEGARYLAGKVVGYFGTNVSPALLAVGFIVGLNIAIVVFAGGAIAWYVFVPLYSAFPELDPNIAAYAATHPAALDLGYEIWDTKIRYIGVGSMLVGGIWSLIEMRHSLLAGIASARGVTLAGGWNGVPHTERDLPLFWILLGSLAMVVPIYLLYDAIVDSTGIAAAMAVIMVVAGFLFAAVSSYMAGLVGSSNNPTSGMTIATLLFAALVLLALMGPDATTGPAAAIMIGAVVCCAAAIGGDNLQDLKAGYLVGATPWKQQVMLAVGAVASALVMAPVLNLLLAAYGLGPATPEHPNSLLAPQATLMASVARGVFGDNLPWDMVGVGALVGAIIIAIDKLLAARGSNFRVPVLAAAIGIYLPLELTTPILAGGFIAHLAERWNARNAQGQQRDSNARNGTLFAAGLITGEALVGILMAIPIVVFRDRDVLAIADHPYGGWPGLVVVALLGYVAYRVGTRGAVPR
ncbi:MAG TPA: oligopeptide transporter, OPT family [Gammaproteobacteria bacterium]|nr:oligopeptide transporter, OPT family [Gammaproteobacteria bacterium]